MDLVVETAVRYANASQADPEKTAVHCTAWEGRAYLSLSLSLSLALSLFLSEAGHGQPVTAPAVASRPSRKVMPARSVKAWHG